MKISTIYPSIIALGLLMLTCWFPAIAYGMQVSSDTRCGSKVSKPPSIRLPKPPSGKAVANPKPVYPQEARRRKVRGTVAVEVVIDEKGAVIWAKAASGPKVLRAAAVNAACSSRFVPVTRSRENVKASFIIRYRFNG